MEITSNTDQILLRIDQRIASAKDTTRLMKNISIDMKNKIDRRFQTESDPNGKKWAKNTEVTIKRKGSSKVGHDTGILASSMHSKNTRDSAVAGTNKGGKKGYAGTFNYGARKGQYGRAKNNAPIPWGNIPSRKFIGFSSNQKKLYTRWIKDFLK